MFLTFPFIDQAIARFGCWSTSVIAIFQQLRKTLSCSSSENALPRSPLTANRAVIYEALSLKPIATGDIGGDDDDEDSVDQEKPAAASPQASGLGKLAMGTTGKTAR
jgi:hypothetical protein